VRRSEKVSLLQKHYPRLLKVGLGAWRRLSIFFYRFGHESNPQVFLAMGSLNGEAPLERLSWK